MFDYTLFDHGRSRYNEMLRAAENERRAAQLRRSRRQGSAFNHLMLHISDWLIDSGAWLKQHNEMHPGLR